MLKAEVEKYAEHPLYITWAAVEPSSLDYLQGIWSYLCRELEPLMEPRCSQVNTIRVGLPWAPKRIMDPPKDQWDRLPTPLTPGEREVFEMFNGKLFREWEMYIQPHLNGLRPDLVLLNPYAGIAVFEIKDWSLNTLHSSIKYGWKTQSPVDI